MCVTDSVSVASPARAVMERAERSWHTMRATHTRVLRIAALLIVLSSGWARAADASCTTGVLPSGALSMLCVPPGWNGNLIAFAHGYIESSQPLDFYHLTLPDGTSIPNLVQGLGFAFATTSYRQNGLAILEGVDDIAELVQAFVDVN